MFPGNLSRCFFQKFLLEFRSFSEISSVFLQGFRDTIILAGISTCIRQNISSDNHPSSIRSKIRYFLKTYSDPSRNISRYCFSILSKEFYPMRIHRCFLQKSHYKYLLKFPRIPVEILSGIIAEKKPF